MTTASLFPIGKPSVKDHMSFRIAVAEHYLAKNKCMRPTSFVTSTSIRFDGIGHLVSYSDGKVGRCGQCQKNSTFTCIKCKKLVHPKCFVDFHTR